MLAVLGRALAGTFRAAPFLAVAVVRLRLVLDVPAVLAVVADSAVAPVAPVAAVVADAADLPHKIQNGEGVSSNG